MKFKTDYERMFLMKRKRVRIRSIKSKINFIESVCWSIKVSENNEIKRKKMKRRKRG